MKALTIITAVLTIILGIYAMATPFRVFLGIGWLLGIFFMIHGIEMAAGGFGKKKSVWQGILGILVTIAGLIVLINGVQRFFTDLMIAYFIAATIILTGLGMLVVGIKIVKANKSRGILNIVCGVLEIILGIAALMHPIITMISVGYIIAACVIMQGISFISMGFSMGKDK